VFLEHREGLGAAVGEEHVPRLVEEGSSERPQDAALVIDAQDGVPLVVHFPSVSLRSVEPSP
jgi:hypothetical protein